MLEALDPDRGLADSDRDGIVSFNDVVSYVLRQTPVYAEACHGRPQHPTLSGANIGDFSFFDSLIDGVPRAQWLESERRYDEAKSLKDAARYSEAKQTLDMALAIRTCEKYELLSDALQALIQKQQSEALRRSVPKPPVFVKPVSMASPAISTERKPESSQDALGLGLIITLVVLVLALCGVFIAVVMNSHRAGTSDPVESTSSAPQDPVAPVACDPKLWSTATQGGERNGVTIQGVNYAFRYCPPTGADGFWMGSPIDERGRFIDEHQHKVVLSKGFWILETETTQRLWESVMGSNPSRFQGADLPVEQVNWDDCNAFVENLNSGGYAPQGWRFRLPTEAQWEYACRAGSSEPYGGVSLDEVGWHAGNSNDKSHEAGLKRANAWGLFDMCGNVWEWVYDSWNEQLTDAIDPCYDAQDSGRVGRSGAWYDGAQYCRAACRCNYPVDVRYDGVGVRLALVPVQGTAPPVSCDPKL